MRPDHSRATWAIGSLITDFEAGLERFRIMNRAETGCAGFDQFGCDDGRHRKIEGKLHGAVSRRPDGYAAIAILSTIRMKSSLMIVHPAMETARSVVRP